MWFLLHMLYNKLQSLGNVQILYLVAPLPWPPLPSLEPVIWSFSLVPPVPQKLIEKIEAGNFIDMPELLSDHMAVFDNGEATSSTKKKRRNVTNILHAVLHRTHISACINPRGISLSVWNTTFYTYFDKCTVKRCGAMPTYIQCAEI